jgi:hypothetical protein
MFFKKVISTLVICTFFLSSCVTNGNQKSSLNVGPLLSSSFFKSEVDDQGVAKPKLDVVIPVFDPGLPEDTKQYEEKGIWPELRRAESTRFAYKLKEALDATGKFGAVRVTPDATATGDLYILGTIVESDGEDVEIAIEALDASGKVWMDTSFDHEVDQAFHNDLRNDGKDPYDPMFTEAAEGIADELKYHGAKDLEDLQYVTNLRFGASFSEEAFMPHMMMDGDEVQLVSKMSEEDPMYRRMMAIRTRDQLFVDGLQSNYARFSEKMDESYLMWQEQSLLEHQAERDANMAAAGQAAGGVLLIGLAVLAAVAGAKSDSYGGATAGATGAVVGGVVGAGLLQKSFKTSEEAKVHRDALNELGQSLDMELAPQVIEFEKETVKLTGDAKEQFQQWRTFLKKIYAEEATPDLKL